AKDALHLEPGKKGVELAFDPPPAPPAQINLDADQVTIEVRVTSEGIEQDGFDVELKDAQSSKVFKKVKAVRGKATFDLPPAVFGPPGRGEILATFAGAPGFSSSHTSSPAHRTAIAKFHDARAEDPKGGVAADGIPILGRVASKAGMPASGIVEAFLMHDGTLENVGAANVDGGDFKIVPRWLAKKDGSANILLKFTPSGEGWIPEEQGAIVVVQAKTPGPWRAIAAMSAGLLLVLILLRSRRAPKVADQQAQAGERDPVIRVAKKARAPRIIELTVRDRRRRTPIVGARVRAARPTPTSAERIGEGATGGDGRLRLVLTTPVRTGDQLLVTHRAFLPLAIDLPRAAELELGLTRRRDAVLDVLLDWAR